MCKVMLRRSHVSLTRQTAASFQVMHHAAQCDAAEAPRCGQDTAAAQAAWTPGCCTGPRAQSKRSSCRAGTAVSARLLLALEVFSTSGQALGAGSIAAVQMVPGSGACVSACYGKQLLAWDVGRSRPSLLGTLGQLAAPVLKVCPALFTSCADTRPAGMLS